MHKSGPIGSVVDSQKRIQVHVSTLASKDVELELAHSILIHRSVGFMCDRHDER